MELGSNSPVIVMDDADITFAIPKIITGAFAVAGQICISVQRLLVHETIYDEFLKGFVEGVKKLKIGDPLNENIDMGPMISEQSAKRAENWIKEAVNNGAKDLTDSKRDRTILTPAILIDVTPEMKVFKEEAFAPLVTITKIRNIEDAVDLANKSRYGLQAGILKIFYMQSMNLKLVVL